jgi:hypothetical protein
MIRTRSRDSACSALDRARSVGVLLLVAAMLAACSAPDAAVILDSEAEVPGKIAANIVAGAEPSATLSDDGGSNFFHGRQNVSVEELFEGMAMQADALSSSPTLRNEYEVLRERHRLRHSAELYTDFLRVRMAFEATRAGGLWGLEWRVTDQLPQSDRIWTQWRSMKPGSTTTVQRTTAIAECDELSALFAFVAYGMGLSDRSRIGLFWPTSNHTVAVWAIVDENGKDAARIVVPTSQIFLDDRQSLDTRGFDPWKQQKIYDYRRKDVSAQDELPVEIARYFVTQALRHGRHSTEELQTIRNRREREQRIAAARR